MIVAKTPFRIGLVGGSTDLQKFIDVNKYGSVISFPVNKYTYISIYESHDTNYKIVYSKVELTDDVSKIQNDIAREVLKYFDAPPLTVVFNADIPAVRGGLAASSSYTISMIKAVSMYMKKEMTQFDICRLALEIERKFNILTGYQDTYGCGMPCLKRIHIYSNEIIFKYLDTNMFENINMYLYDTKLRRGSTAVLSDINIDKAAKLIPLVAEMEETLNTKNIKEFHKIMSNSWEQKKATSRLIMENKQLSALDEYLRHRKDIQSYKLLGAGGGGYFLVFSDQLLDSEDFIEIKIDNVGVTGMEV